MLVAVHAIGATGGHCDETGYREGALGAETGPEVGVVNGADEARRAVRFGTQVRRDSHQDLRDGRRAFPGGRSGYTATDAGRARRAGG